MNVADLVLRVRTDFGDEYNVIITEPDVYRWIYAGEVEVIRNNGGNIGNVTHTSTSFPVTVTENVTIRRLAIANRLLLPIFRHELDSLRLKLTNEGLPGFWYMVGEALHLYPKANVSEQVDIEYNKLPVVITGPPPVPTTLTIPDVWHPDLVNFVLARANEKRGNLQKAQYFQEMFDKNMGRRTQEDEGADVIYYKGIDPLDFEEYSGIEFWG